MHMLEEKREINAYAPKTKLHLFCSKFGTLFTYIGILSKSDASRESIDALDFLRDLRIGHSSPSVSADGTKLGWNGAPQNDIRNYRYQTAHEAIHQEAEGSRLAKYQRRKRFRYTNRSIPASSHQRIWPFSAANGGT
jgi:hypothetical protein